MTTRERVGSKRLWTVKFDPPNRKSESSHSSKTRKDEFIRHLKEDAAFLNRCHNSGFNELHNFSRKEKLGEGTYGFVARAVHRVSGTDVAIKKIKPEADEVGLSPTTIREITLLNEVKHPYIVQLISSMFSKGNVYLVFEYCEHDLRKYQDIYRRQSGNNGLPLATVQRFQYQMCKAIEFCHVNRVYHRDLKPQNVLVTSDGDRVKIADFGLARQHGLPLSPLTREVVTLWYRSPEILLGARVYDQGVDTWALGCIFAEMLTGHALFEADCEIDCVFRILRLVGTPSPGSFPTHQLPYWQDKFPKFKARPIRKAVPRNGLSDEGYKYLRSFLELNPLYRIDSVAAAKHPWLSSHIAASRKQLDQTPVSSHSKYSDQLSLRLDNSPTKRHKNITYK